MTLEGIYDNNDGTFVAYFSYVNASGSRLQAPVGDAQNTRNFFSPGPASRGQPSEFLNGEHRGVFQLVFDGAPLVWTVKVGAHSEIQIPVSAGSPKLPRVTPLADCINQRESGGFASVWGYNNPNDFEVSIPVGSINSFSPGAPDRGQPNKFFSGLNRGAFDVPLDSSLEWKLPGASAVASPQVNVCACPTTDNRNTKRQILQFCQKLGALVYEAADQIEQASRERLAGSPPEVRRKLREGVERAKKRAAEAALRAQDFSSSLPAETRSCPGVARGCSRVDDGATLAKLRKYHYDSLSIIRRMNARSDFIRSGETKRGKEIVRRAAKLTAEGLAEINKIPRFRTVCK